MKTDLPTLLKLHRLTPFITEHRFRKGRNWRFDYAWPGIKVALEVEGGVYTGGRHVRGQGYENDCRKYSEAAILGWRVIRVTTGMVDRGEAIDLVKRAFGIKELE